MTTRRDRFTYRAAQSIVLVISIIVFGGVAGYIFQILSEASP